MFARVVGIATVKGQGKVPDMANYLAGEFQRAGWADSDVEVLADNNGSPDDTAIDPTPHGSSAASAAASRRAKIR